MAKKIYDESINKNQDWGGDASTGNLPVSGRSVQEFIKNTFEQKIGILYYDATANRYLAFADEETRNTYLNDTTQTNLVLGTFDAPFNYSASINLISKSNVSIFTGTTGNYIEFTFDTTNKNGASVGEGVVCTYTFIRNSNKKVVTAKYNYGEKVRFLIDDYIDTGTNTITIGIQGQNTLAATTVAVIYQVVNLTLKDSFDISKLVTTSLEIPYTIEGQGVKTVHYYIDNVEQEFNKDEDEITDYSAERTKFIEVNLSQGLHTLQIQADTVIDETTFTTDILYREFIVATDSVETYIACKYTIPAAKGLKELTDPYILYDIAQYVQYTLYFAVYNGKKPAYTPTEVYVDTSLQTTLQAENNVVQAFSYTFNIAGSSTIDIKANGVTKSFQGTIEGSSMDVEEITNALSLAFSATGRTNSDSNKTQWSYGTAVGTLKGFYYNTVSGWVDNSLYINSGASFDINKAFLEDPETFGKTLEFSLRTTNVSDDSAVICDMTTNGIGLKITASEASLTSREGSVVSTRFKSEEDVRISFVINKKSGVTNKGLAFIYINGILSGAERFSNTDTFASATKFNMTGTEKAEIKLYQIRVYDTALSHNQILNNYILYQQDSKALQEVYYKNDILDDNSISVDRISRFLPVLLVTGDIPTLENTTNKKEQITVDLEYTNLQDPTRSFTAKKVAMTPQGTSSMSYPKKNFRIYFQKIGDTILYDANGNVVENKLYQFKDKAQPVKTFCLKADYAESSSTHNTGIARLWNNVLYNTQIDGDYKLRTDAQKLALKNNYEYDVRTAIDGFPIVMFYRPDENSEYIFMGKYNFNNDKSTESVYGFKDIPGFDNTHMQCWEVLNNGHHLSLFTDTTNWDSEWADAYEGRYPDSSTDTTDLKAFCEWVVSCKDNPTKFSTEKYDHLNVYITAAYYVYLLRFGAVDQVAKNAMLTSEDGQHFYFINYDNDTVLGVRNDGLLVYDPTITRQSLDPTMSTETYAYAGHDSVLWNLCEADSDFMSIVSTVDNALYQAGLRYSDVIDMFNNQQSAKWCERVYNQDSQYKYISPYVNSAVNNLFMLQGSRESHRKWWLSRRFNLVDSWFVSGAYKSNVLECKMASAPIGIQFSITAGFDMNYGYGVNNVPASTGVSLKTGESTTFTTTQVLNLGDPMRIYSANNLQAADLSGFVSYLSTVNVAKVYDSILGTKLKKLILGDGVHTNTSLTEIQGITAAERLEYLDIRGYKGMNTLDLSKANLLKTLYAENSGLKSVDFAAGNPFLTTIKLPSTMQSLVLDNLPNLSTFTLQDGAKLINLSVTGCPNVSEYTTIAPVILSNKDSLETLTLDNINWGISVEKLLAIVSNSFTCNFKGHVTVDSITQEQVDTLKAIFGDTVFNPSSSFYVTAPSSIYVTGADTILEGNSAKYSATVFTSDTTLNKIYWKISTKTGVTIEDTGTETTTIKTTETGAASSNVTLTVQYVDNDNNVMSVTKTITIQRRIYPTQAQLQAAISYDSNTFTEVGEEHSFTVQFDSTITGKFNIGWDIISGDITGYLSISSTINNVCRVKMMAAAAGVADGQLQVTLTKQLDDSTTKATIPLVAKNATVAITKKSNPTVMAKLYAAGLCASEDYMTYTECALVTDDDWAKVSFYNVDYTSSSSWTFDEFQYFTGVTTIAASQFKLSPLSKITFPPNITTIKTQAFNSVRKVLDIELPSTLTTLESQAFYNLKFKNTVIEIPDGVTTIPASCFAVSNITEINLNKVTTVNANAFQDCSNLTSISTINHSLTLYRYAFAGCGKLTNVPTVSGYTVNLKGQYQFQNCKGLVDIDLSDYDFSGITGDPFVSCENLRNVTIGKFPLYKLSGSRYRLYHNMFSNCKSLTFTGSIYDSDTKILYFTANGDVYITNYGAIPASNCGLLLHKNSNDYVPPSEDILMAGGTLYIDVYAFTTLNKETFELDLGSKYALEVDNQHLPFVYYTPKQITIKGNYLIFHGDGGNTFPTTTEEVTLQATGSIILEYAFLYCNGLSKVTLDFLGSGNEILTLGIDCFRGCTNLSTIICTKSKGSQATLYKTAFGTSTSDYTGYSSKGDGTVNKLYVPADATGYDESYWADPLQNADKCGFTISKTL